MINIVYDHQTFTGQRYGGISRYFAETFVRLKSIPDLSARLGFIFSKNEHLKNLVRREVLYYSRGHRVFSRVNDLIGRARVARAQIVHTTYYQRDDLVNVAGKKHVVTVYDMIPELFPELFPAGNPHLDKAAYCHCADLIICISEQTRIDLLDIYKIDERKTITIHLGASAQGACDQKKASQIGAPYLLFIGCRAAYKNFSTLLSAFAITRNRHRGLLLVCAGGGTFTDQEEKLVATLKLTGAVRQLDTTDAEIRGLLSASSGLVSPSLYEGFGLPVLEAFIARCPVALSDIATFREVANDAALYFDPRDPEACAHAIDHMLENSVSTQQRVARGAKICSRLDWERTARLHAHAYRQIA